jgi:hypothetical protein
MAPSLTKQAQAQETRCTSSPRPTNTDDVSKMFSPDEMEKQGCRFATWGWVCDEAPKGVEGGDKEAEDELLALGLDLSALGEVGSDGKNVERET